MKPLIVHITADYPDAWTLRKTRAVAALVEGSADRFDHRVYSLNRDGSGLRSIVSPGSVAQVADDGSLATWSYAAPAGGVFLASSMKQVADAVVADVRRQGLQVALVQGHKLSFEGIAARSVATQLGIPYVLTLQGNTDQKVLRIRKDLRGLYRQVWRDAAVVFPFTPWIADWCGRMLGPRTAPIVSLPCIPVADAIIAPVPGPPRVITAFHLDHWRNKNIVMLARACTSLRATYPDLVLEVAGAGSPEAERRVDAALAQAGTAGFARRIGAVDGGAIQAWMNGAAVLALPSKRESFGMVFVEALLAGCPIVYPSGRAVEGYFEGASFALGADPQDIGEIAAAIGRILNNNTACKTELAAWQSKDAARFQRRDILDCYAAALDQALATP